MTQIVQFVVLFGIGLIAGFMSGMFGIGGGSVRIPLLNLAGLHLLTAFAINLFGYTLFIFNWRYNTADECRSPDCGVCNHRWHLGLSCGRIYCGSG